MPERGEGFFGGRDAERRAVRAGGNDALLAGVVVREAVAPRGQRERERKFVLRAVLPEKGQQGTAPEVGAPERVGDGAVRGGVAPGEREEVAAEQRFHAPPGVEHPAVPFDGVAGRGRRPPLAVAGVVEEPEGHAAVDRAAEAVGAAGTHRRPAAHERDEMAEAPVADLRAERIGVGRAVEVGAPQYVGAAQGLQIDAAPAAAAVVDKESRDPRAIAVPDFVERLDRADLRDALAVQRVLAGVGQAGVLAVARHAVADERAPDRVREPLPGLGDRHVDPAHAGRPLAEADAVGLAERAAPLGVVLHPADAFVADVGVEPQERLHAGGAGRVRDLLQPVGIDAAVLRPVARVVGPVLGEEILVLLRLVVGPVPARVDPVVVEAQAVLLDEADVREVVRGLHAAPRGDADRREGLAVFVRGDMVQHEVPAAHVLRPEPVALPEQHQDARLADLFSGVQDEMRLPHARRDADGPVRRRRAGHGPDARPAQGEHEAGIRPAGDIEEGRQGPGAETRVRRLRERRLAVEEVVRPALGAVQRADPGAVRHRAAPVQRPDLLDDGRVGGAGVLEARHPLHRRTVLAVERNLQRDLEPRGGVQERMPARPHEPLGEGPSAVDEGERRFVGDADGRGVLGGAGEISVRCGGGHGVRF